MKQTRVKLMNKAKRYRHEREMLYLLENAADLLESYVDGEELAHEIRQLLKKVRQNNEI